ncbi:hypothetical protein [Actinomadura macrotermitis]|uniref:PqqD family protein n=1 Tax=Actinomadura macrotermitis TaxID=2585200 RepID=A0A7K0C8E8_9ACTN|nr:hypothetical protein [Actinomadura macrotermitis]MQY09708.1 hypothetical protein [Actinomadura macrotermitis]
MRVRLKSEVEVTLLRDGSLRLFCEVTGADYTGEPAAAAMWVALVQHDGDSRQAADLLAETWDTDPAYTRASMEVWIEELCALSLVRLEI